jgi:tetratricopeptide (TPR) repeat protein
MWIVSVMIGALTGPAPYVNGQDGQPQKQETPRQEPERQDKPQTPESPRGGIRQGFPIEAPASQPAKEWPPESLRGEVMPDFAGDDLGARRRVWSRGFPEQVVLADLWRAGDDKREETVGELRRLNAKYGSRGLVIISVAFAKDAEEVRPIIEKDRMTWANLLENGEDRKASVAKYGVKAVPMLYLRNPDYRVQWQSPDAKGLDEELETLMKRVEEARPARRIAQAVREFNAANQFHTQKRYYEAWLAFQRVVRQYEGTQPAADAQARIAAYEKDAEIWQQIQKSKTEFASRNAQNMLSLARMLVASEKYDTARKLYERVIADYPDTEEAATAEAEMQALP